MLKKRSRVPPNGSMRLESRKGSNAARYRPSHYIRTISPQAAVFRKKAAKAASFLSSKTVSAMLKSMQSLSLAAQIDVRPCFTFNSIGQKRELSALCCSRILFGGPARYTIACARKMALSFSAVHSSIERKVPRRCRHSVFRLL